MAGAASQRPARAKTAAEACATRATKRKFGKRRSPCMVKEARADRLLAWEKVARFAKVPCRKPLWEPGETGAPERLLIRGGRRRGSPGRNPAALPAADCGLR